MPLRNNRKLLYAALGAGAYCVARSIVKKRRQFSFAGKLVLITGSSRGLGLVLAREFASQGARLALCARSGNELEIARAELSAAGADVSAFVCDVADRAQVDQMISRINNQLGPIDVLVNNAGVITVGPLESMEVEDFEHSMKVNFFGPLYTTMAVLPGMRERGEGRVVNIASIGGKVSVPHLSTYSTSKFALVGLSRGLRAELGRDGIKVTTVCPGLMRTGSPRNADFKGNAEAEYAWFNISDTSPFSSMSAESAARQIVDACRRGVAEIVLSPQAKLVATLDALFPEWNAKLLAAVNRMLPNSPEGPSPVRKGYESESKLTRSFLTKLGQNAEVRNNQLQTTI